MKKWVTASIKSLTQDYLTTKLRPNAKTWKSDDADRDGQDVTSSGNEDIIERLVHLQEDTNRNLSSLELSSYRSRSIAETLRSSGERHAVGQVPLNCMLCIMADFWISKWGV
jgi:hypothetical protein